MRAGIAFASTLALAAFAARGAPSPPRSGTGILGVPDAETLPPGWSVAGIEAGLGRSPGRVEVGVAPISLALGLGRAELAASFRESGSPGDPRPATPLGSGALKIRLLDAGAWTPAVALGVTADRINDDPRWGARLLISTPPIAGARIALAGGLQTRQWRTSELQPFAAAAASLDLPQGLAVLAAGHATPDGPKLETGLRWSPVAWLSLGFGFERVPRENQNRFVLGIAIQSSPRLRPAPIAADAAPAATTPSAAPPIRFPDERPRFHLRTRRAAPAAPPHETDPEKTKPSSALPDAGEGRRS